MSDLISRKRIEFELCESNMPKKYREFCRRVINSESLSPSADAEPVVRCKECRHSHWEQEPCHGKVEYYCPKLGNAVDKYFYCALGEKRGAKMDETEGE